MIICSMDSRGDSCRRKWAVCTLITEKNQSRVSSDFYCKWGFCVGVFNTELLDAIFCLTINGKKQALWEFSARCFFSTPFWLLRTMWANGISPTVHSVVSGLHVQLSICSFLNFFMLYFSILYGHLIRRGNTHLYILFYIQMYLVCTHRVHQVITLSE